VKRKRLVGSVVGGAVMMTALWVSQVIRPESGAGADGGGRDSMSARRGDTTCSGTSAQLARGEEMDKAINLLEDQEVQLGLPLSGYRLIPGYTGHLGLPVEIYLRLYAVKDQEKRLIASPDDLSRIVTHIDDQDAAWRFLRLFTAPATHYLFQKGLYTIDLEVSSPGLQTGEGMISREVAQRIGFQPAEMTRENHQYVASRDLVRANAIERGALAEVLRRRETLSEGAAYCLIEDRVKGRIAREDVAFPSYE
jgi:hypothetical protein